MELLKPENLQALFIALGGVVMAVLVLWAVYVKATETKEDDARLLKVLEFLKKFAPKSMASKIEAIEEKVKK